MLHILNLFGRSHFAPLQGHMGKVADCVEMLRPLFEAVQQKDYEEVARIAEEISTLEHAADLTKNDIRDHLPGSLFLLDRGTFLSMLSFQDSIADRAEDIAVQLTLRPMEFLESFRGPYLRFLDKNIECFYVARQIILELHELLESSFGGEEAKKVKTMCDAVAYKEHEADVIQRDLLRHLYASVRQMDYDRFYQWQEIFKATAAISNLSEQLANCVRMTLDIK